MKGKGTFAVMAVALVVILAGIPVLAGAQAYQPAPPQAAPPNAPPPQSGMAPQPPPQQMEQRGQRGSQEMAQQQQYAPERASKIMGAAVKNDRGQTIARVKDIIFNREAQPVYLVVSHEGRLIPIPFGMIRFDQRNNDIIVPGLTTAALSNAPCFSTWNLLGNPRFENQIHAYYEGAANREQGGPGPAPRQYQRSPETGPGAAPPPGEPQGRPMSPPPGEPQGRPMR